MDYGIEVRMSEEKPPRPFYRSYAQVLRAQHGDEGIAAIYEALKEEKEQEKNKINRR